MLKRRVLETRKWDAKNVVILTSTSSLSDFDEFDNSFITALDFSLLEVPEGFELDSYYYPYTEAAFFALIRAIGTFDFKETDESAIEEYSERLWKWYQRIPNLKKLTKTAFIETVFEGGKTPKHTVILKLIIPDAVRFDPRDVYTLVKEFLIKA